MEIVPQQLCDTHYISFILQVKAGGLEDSSDEPKAHSYQGQPRSRVTMLCQLHIGTCHLPLQGLYHELQQLLTFNTP